MSPDAKVVMETTFPTFLELAERYGVLIWANRSFPQRVWWRTPDNGIANIVFRSKEVPDKLRGPNKSILWLDEASVMRREVFDIAAMTLRQGGKWDRR